MTTFAFASKASFRLALLVQVLAYKKICTSTNLSQSFFIDKSLLSKANVFVYKNLAYNFVVCLEVSCG